ncbi:UV-stimulated scaffold protein A isoform X3 [Fukomys damarensis]|uniref:UV-stimulated scaffold protein A isoform X3 n=1 Tax=Fukomys damarensis TaxID=885580 RepID=UPI00053FB606|nr:UV-stimulated scaffold protein A isoform X3 [Fukomys damarensis]
MDQKLPKLVEELTTSGEPQLNPEKMKELKKICKSSEEHLSHAYRLLMTQLSQDHAEIRLSAFRIVDVLFARSHQFRLLLISDFQEFLELTLGTDHEQPLPPPREAAQRLKQAAVHAVEGWNEQFGEAYKKLALGYHFLRHTKKVDFQDVNARTLAERKREEEKQKHLDRIYGERAEQAAREMEEMSEEIGCCLMEVENCFKLLVPLDLGDEEQPCCSRDLPASACHPGAAAGGEGLPQTAAGGPSEDEDEDSDPEEFVRSHGLGSHKYTLAVELSSDSLRVQENEDNRAVLHAARDALKLIQNKFLPAVSSWVQRFTRAMAHGGHLKRAIDLKTELELVLQKYEELDIEPDSGHCGDRGQTLAAPWEPSAAPAALTVEGRFQTGAPRHGEDEDDEDFVEVPEKEDYEPHIPDHLRAEYGLEPKSSLQTLEKDAAAWGAQARRRIRREEEESDPTSAAAQLCRLQDRLPRAPPSPTRAPLAPEEAQKLAEEQARAPVVPFGVDLCYWGEEQQTVGKIFKADSEHRFWKPSEVEGEVDSADVCALLRSRHITFAGKFEPVQHRCRAPRPDGRLCERQDRLKCPFHGKIVPRDDMGQPLDPEDRAREQQQRLQQPKRPDWQDPEFMKDVEAATGTDLGSARYGGKGKGKRRKYPKLTDLRAQASTSRARLGKKVFAKQASGLSMPVLRILPATPSKCHTVSGDLREGCRCTRPHCHCGVGTVSVPSLGPRTCCSQASPSLPNHMPCVVLLS